MAQQPLVRQTLLIVETSRSHSDTPHPVRLLWTSDHSDVETSLPNYTQHSQQSSIPPEGFESAIPTSKRPRPHASDRAATRGRHTYGISNWNYVKILMRESGRIQMLKQCSVDGPDHRETSSSIPYNGNSLFSDP